jgi:hypothetical protein
VDRPGVHRQTPAFTPGVGDLLSATTETEVADITVDVVQRVLDQPLAAMWSYSSVDEVLSPLAATDAARAVDGSCETADASGRSDPVRPRWKCFTRGR